jgi:hypothetical protein
MDSGNGRRWRGSRRTGCGLRTGSEGTEMQRRCELGASAAAHYPDPELKTAAGARVITASSSGAHVQPALANAIGLAKVAYGVGNSPLGTPIKVTTTVTKGSQRGVCATSFVPSTLPGEPIVTRDSYGRRERLDRLDRG